MNNTKHTDVITQFYTFSSMREKKKKKAVCSYRTLKPNSLSHYSSSDTLNHSFMSWAFLKSLYKSEVS